jgi:excinuclease ABC subunit B
VQPTYAQSTSRVRRPSLDDMGPGTDRPVPHRASSLSDPGPAARRPDVDPRTKAGAFGERIRGPHKPTLDEMGPHAMLSVPKGKPPPTKPRRDPPPPGGEWRGEPPSPPPPGGEGSELAPGLTRGVGGTPPPAAGAKPTRTVEIPSEGEKRGRRGRSKKTGRPGA